jgi:hypothetical protein
VRLTALVPRQAAGRDRDGGPPRHGVVVFWSAFVVPDEASGVAAVGPDQGDGGEVFALQCQQPVGAAAVLHILGLLVIKLVVHLDYQKPHLHALMTRSRPTHTIRQQALRA